MTCYIKIIYNKNILNFFFFFLNSSMQGTANLKILNFKKIVRDPHPFVIYVRSMVLNIDYDHARNQKM
jgi:hypothetical protein